MKLVLGLPTLARVLLNLCKEVILNPRAFPRLVPYTENKQTGQRMRELSIEVASSSHSIDDVANQQDDEHDLLQR